MFGHTEGTFIYAGTVKFECNARLLDACKRPQHDIVSQSVVAAGPWAEWRPFNSPQEVIGMCFAHQNHVRERWLAPSDRGIVCQSRQWDESEIFTYQQLSFLPVQVWYNKTNFRINGLLYQNSNEKRKFPCHDVLEKVSRLCKRSKTLKWSALWTSKISHSHHVWQDARPSHLFLLRQAAAFRVPRLAGQRSWRLEQVLMKYHCALDAGEAQIRTWTDGPEPHHDKNRGQCRGSEGLSEPKCRTNMLLQYSCRSKGSD